MSNNVIDASRPLRIGIAGAGFVAETAHLPAIANSPELELAAVLEPDADQREKLAPLYPARYCATADEFFATDQMQAVIIATPNDTHHELAARAMDLGLHVLVEKPLARSYEESVDLVERAERAGVTLAVGLQKRFHPTFSKVRQVVESGAIGEPYFVGVHWASNTKLNARALVGAEGLRRYGWRWAGPQVGGGIIQDHLPHYLDLVRYWTGKELVSVTAFQQNVARDRIGWEPADSLWEDFGLVVAQFEGKLMLRFESGIIGRSLSPIWSLGSGKGEWTEYGYLLGTKGQLVFDVLPWDSSEVGRLALWELDRAVEHDQGWTYLEHAQPKRSVGRPSGAASSTFIAQLEAWKASIHGDQTPIATGRDGVAAAAAVDAAYASVESGGLISVTDKLTGGSTA